MRQHRKNRTTGFRLAALLACLAAALPLSAQYPQPKQPATASPGIATVTLPSAGSPLVAIRLMFDAGSVYDPPGKEGLAALTALMIGRAGTQKRSYSDLLEALYPLGSSIDVNGDREVSVLSVGGHQETLAAITALLEEVVLQPAFAESDFQRNKEQLLTILTATLRGANDELLGLEAIQTEIFAGHPYGHPAIGTVDGLNAVTLDDVKRFYKERYTQASLLLGLAGGYPADYPAKLQKTLSALPPGQPGRKELPPPPKVDGRRFTLIEKQTGSVGIHLGFPLPVNRADADYYPLMVANSYLGEHRSFFGRLYLELREARGLNYGDYTYIEFMANPPSTRTPTPNVPRRQQYFSLWIRPVVPETAHFALRNALYELDLLREKGMSKEDFELTRGFMINYSKLWAQSLSERLGFLMDSRFYGMPYYIDEIDKRLAAVTLDDVNRVIRKYLRTDAYHAVLVTDDAAALKAALEKDEPSPMKYGSKVADEVLEADKTIEKVKVAPTSVAIVPVGQVFQK